MVKVGDIWYRVEHIRYAPPLDEWGEPVGYGRSDLRLCEFEVIKLTPKGVRINNHNRFILNTAAKRFACPTRREAYESFLARSKKYLLILQAREKRLSQMMSLALIQMHKEEKDLTTGVT
jgi:hypothetical protein